MLLHFQVVATQIRCLELHLGARGRDCPYVRALQPEPVMERHHLVALAGAGGGDCACNALRPQLRNDSRVNDSGQLALLRLYAGVRAAAAASRV